MKAFILRDRNQNRKIKATCSKQETSKKLLLISPETHEKMIQQTRIGGTLKEQENVKYKQMVICNKKNTIGLEHKVKGLTERRKKKIKNRR